jgi:phosphatidate phosphatase APP1
MKKVPTLLNFYGLSNGKVNLFVGQLCFAFVNDFTFQQYSRRKTFWTLLGLFRSKAIRNQEFELVFEEGVISAKTDLTGSFWCTSTASDISWTLKEVKIKSDKAVILDDLYALGVNHITSSTVLISDIDDTLLHSDVRNKVRQFRNLLFTKMEKRRAVKDTHDLIRNLEAQGAASFYLSNSEQNLYPLIYRFLRHNDFPEGPLFLKQWRTIRDFFRRHHTIPRNAHKLGTLENIMEIFPDKKFILIGDNTQLDLSIYLQTALKYPHNIKSIVIREVYDRLDDESLVETAKQKLAALNINFHYGATFSAIRGIRL